MELVGPIIDEIKTSTTGTNQFFSNNFSQIVLKPKKFWRAVAKIVIYVQGHLFLCKNDWSLLELWYETIP